MSYRLVLDETIDVDAITLSLARMSHDDLIMPVAVTGIVIAAAVNSLVKGGMATVVGGRKIGLWDWIAAAGRCHWRVGSRLAMGFVNDGATHSGSRTEIGKLAT